MYYKYGPNRKSYQIVFNQPQTQAVNDKITNQILNMKKKKLKFRFIVSAEFCKFYKKKKNLFLEHKKSAVCAFVDLYAKYCLWRHWIHFCLFTF